MIEILLLEVYLKRTPVLLLYIEFLSARIVYCFDELVSDEIFLIDLIRFQFTSYVIILRVRAP